MRIILISNMAWSGMGQTNRQAWALALAELYPRAQIVYLENMGWNLKPSFRLSAQGDSRSIFTLHSWNALPWGGRPRWGFVRALNHRLTAWQIRRAMRSAGFCRFDLLVTFDPLSQRLVRLIGASKSVYDCLDLYEAQPQYCKSPVVQRVLNSSEAALSRDVDLVSVSSIGLRERFERLGVPVRYVAGATMSLRQSGAEAQERASDFSRPDPIVAVYVGALDEYKVDFRVFQRLLDIDPTLILHVVGSQQAKNGLSPHWLALLSEHPRIVLHGPVERSALPSILSDADFGVIAMTPSPYSHFSFPLKFWDYLQSGIPVLAVGCEALQPIQPGHVSVENSECVTQLTIREVLNQGKDRSALVSFAQANDAVHRVSTILKSLNERSDSGATKSR